MVAFGRRCGCLVLRCVVLTWGCLVFSFRGLRLGGLGLRLGLGLGSGLGLGLGLELGLGLGLGFGLGLRLHSLG